MHVCVISVRASNFTFETLTFNCENFQRVIQTKRITARQLRSSHRDVRSSTGYTADSTVRVRGVPVGTRPAGGAAYATRPTRR